MDAAKLRRIGSGRGFVAALDQSGGSTPRALEAYGIPADRYRDDDEMFALMHGMRSRIVTSPRFGGDRVLGAILFEDTMDRELGGRPAASYLWDVKQVVPFLKVDKGLEAEERGVQLMRPVPGLTRLLERARAKGMFGTKMRSFVRHADGAGIEAIVEQQFRLGLQILHAGLLPILEAEIDVHSAEKGEAEALLKEGIAERLEAMAEGEQVMLKLSLPEIDDFYADFVHHPKVLRVVALSGGYSRAEADRRLAANHGVIASFSRALTEDLSEGQSDAAFDAILERSIEDIYAASLT